MSDGLADGIVQKVLPKHTRPREFTFKPWHRIRKEVVRQKVWGSAICTWLVRQRHRGLVFTTSDEVQGREIDMSRPLSCLMIPGEHLLDIRAMVRDTEKFGCPIQYLGFDYDHDSSVEGTAVHIANNEVTSNERVVNRSRVVCDRFENLSRQNSPAFKSVKEYGPFHVVNLDFCGTMCPSSGSKYQSYLSAILGLLDYQCRYQPDKWLLFLTTEVVASEIDWGQFNKLIEPLILNCEGSSNFCAHMNELYEADWSRARSLDLKNIPAEEMTTVFGVVLGKWLLNIALRSEPRTVVSLLPSARFLIEERKGVYLLSLALMITPQSGVAEDQTGLSGFEVRSDLRSEIDHAVGLVNSAKSMLNVDELLLDDDFRAQVFLDNAGLMASAGFERQRYEEWFKNGEKLS